MKKTKKTKNTIINTTILLSIIGMSYAGQQHLNAATETTASGAIEMPAKLVQVQHIKEEAVELWREYSSHTVAIHDIEIKPQVSGVITQVLFEDGDLVKEGQVLYRIESSPFDAIVEQEKANILSLESDIKFKKKELDRAEVLVEKNAISKKLHQERLTSYEMSLANLKAAKARLSQASINVGYTYIKSPVTGKIGKTEITKGNLVEGGVMAPVLTKIISSGPIYSEFNIDEQTFLKYLKPYANNKESKNIEVIFENGNGGTKESGHIHFFDHSISTTSGTVKVRAYFDNSKNNLIPGMFGTVKIKVPYLKEAILISEKTIGTNQDRKFVYIVNSDSQVEYREVVLRESVNGQRVIFSGLHDGDVVILDNLMHLRPGMKVKYEDFESTNSTASHDTNQSTDDDNL